VATPSVFLAIEFLRFVSSEEIFRYIAVMSTKLNETQHQAIVMLASGKPASAVAAVLDVRKETVSRWRQLPEFQAEVNAIIEDVREAARNRLAAMVDKALEVIEADLRATDNAARRSRAAFKILQLVGGTALAFTEKPLPTDANTIRKKQDSDRAWGELSL
jgi:hypothetical protein